MSLEFVNSSILSYSSKASTHTVLVEIQVAIILSFIEKKVILTGTFVISIIMMFLNFTKNNFSLKLLKSSTFETQFTVLLSKRQQRNSITILV